MKGTGHRVASFYLNSYGPLVISAAGRAAAEKYSLDPFIDGSIRREPDLEHPFPGISCLCRAGKFAPRLEVGDVVGYLTVKRKYESGKGPHRRLTAILQVREVFPSHEPAASWYRGHGLPLPSSCMVKGNPPQPFNHSHQKHGDRECFGAAKLWTRWDARYRQRVKEYPIFVACNPLFRDLTAKATVVSDADLRHVFGQLPATQNPGRLGIQHLQRLISHLGLCIT